MQQSDGTETTTLSIALIEDDVVDYHWISGMLKRIPGATYNFSWAKTYEEGEALLTNQEFDIAFIDNAIGIHSGIDLVRKFGGRDAATPMVMLTGHGDHDNDIEAMDAGVYDYLEKSTINSQELERSIRYLLKTRKLELELREARDAAEKADNAKSNFLTHLSHDLKTPLNAIVGFAEMITDEDVSPTVATYADQIFSSGKQLTDMIEDLLALTYFDMQQAQCIPRHYTITNLVDEAISLSQYAAMERNVSIKPAYANDDLQIFADKKAIRRILLNLMTVSIKHSHDGGIIFIACAEDKKGTSILVYDDGQGIAPKTITEVMSAGPYSIDGYTTTSNGIGLSLSIVHQYVLMHEGQMQVDSKEGGGTIVKLFFPHASEAVDI